MGVLHSSLASHFLRRTYSTLYRHSPTIIFVLGYYIKILNKKQPKHVPCQMFLNDHYTDILLEWISIIPESR